MKKLVLLFSLVLAVMLFSNVQVKAQYLSTTDTVASNTTNDTSKTFTNSSYENVKVIYKQNSILGSYSLVYTEPQSIRVIYNAADTALYTQVNTILGWTNCGVILTGTIVETTHVPLSLKTGNALINMRKK